MRNKIEQFTDWVVNVGYWIVIGIALVELTIGYLVIRGVIW